ncbi:MAG: hypothetical protein QHI38_05560 [Armatimonadota bacterium]|nr:hypothetical protein [Armatimonadota bacterium]
MKAAFQIAACVFVGMILLTAPVAVQQKYPELFSGTPRNQHISSLAVEKRVKLGMTIREVETVLNLPPGYTRPWVRRRNDSLEVEIAGAQPPWRQLPPGCHSIVLVLDSQKRLIGGWGVWYDSECDDEEPLQLGK